MSDIKTNTKEWKAGDVVTLPRGRRTLKAGDSVVYEQFVESRYLCIRAASDGQRGILVRVLGMAYSGYANIITGQLFWRDDSDSTFYGVRYFAYPMPTANEVQEVLGIIRGSKDLLQRFEEAGMYLDPDSTFWVNDTKRQMLFFRKLQYLDGRDGSLCVAGNNSTHSRISIVYFNKDGELTW